MAKVSGRIVMEGASVLCDAPKGFGRTRGSAGRYLCAARASLRRERRCAGDAVALSMALAKAIVSILHDRMVSVRPCRKLLVELAS